MRFEVMPDVPLYVVGLRGTEEQAAVDLAEGIQPNESRVNRILNELLVRSLWTSEGPVFSSVEDIGALTIDESESLLVEASIALSTISPTYSRQSVDEADAWTNVLEAGAKHHSNTAEMVLLGGAVQYGFHGITHRPDLYWGLPLSDLTDGQLMAYRAARAVYARILRNG